MVPKQNSPGGKTNLGSITKCGDVYLRTLLIQGAKSAVMTAHQRSDRISQWVVRLKALVGWHNVVVALANKNARILWALMTRGARHDPQHVPIPPGRPVMTPTPPCTAQPEYHPRHLSKNLSQACVRRYITQVRPAAGELRLSPEWNPFKQDSTTNEWSPAERFVYGPAPRQGAQGRL